MKKLSEFILLILLILIKSIYSQTCQNNMTINIDRECFNEVLTFNQKNYRAGHFAINNKGDMVAEFSDNYNSRLFYGLKKNGRSFFDTDSNIKEIEISENSALTGNYPRYESNNIFVYLEDDINKEKGFLFNTSSWESVTELHDLENDNYTIITTKDFFGKQIHGYVFPLLEAKINNKNFYFIAYNNDQYGKYFSLKKFGFKDFELDSRYINKTKEESNSHTNRIVRGFIMEEDDIIVIFYMDSSLWYHLNFYDFDLNKLAPQVSINAKVLDPEYDGIFFKGIYLKEKYFSLMYFLDFHNGKSLYLEILKMQISNVNNYGINSILKININKYTLATYILLSEFLKINSERLVYISTTNYRNIYILFFDFYNDYTILKTRVYFFNLHIDELQHEIAGCIYNNFLVFTGRVRHSDEIFYSFFLMFGFPKGEDEIIDISPFIFDIESYNPNTNLVNVLMGKYKIENNLFNYKRIDKLKLGKIPDEIILYDLKKSLRLSEGDLIDVNYRLTYNKDVIKENKYYELEYQFVLVEPDSSEFYNNEETTLNYNDTGYDSQINPLTFYGRTHIIKFKLCHDLCSICKIFGLSNNYQQCLLCSPLYDYNYFRTT